MHDVAVLHDIFLALETELTGFAGTRFAVAGDVVVVSDGFGANEALFEIAVNDACPLRRPRALYHGPGAGLLGSGGEERDQAQEIVAGADHAIESGLRQSERGQ